jgi:hypothetical protein
MDLERLGRIRNCRRRQALVGGWKMSKEMKKKSEKTKLPTKKQGEQVDSDEVEDVSVEEIELEDVDTDELQIEDDATEEKSF